MRLALAGRKVRPWRQLDLQPRPGSAARGLFGKSPERLLLPLPKASQLEGAVTTVAVCPASWCRTALFTLTRGSSCPGLRS